MAKRKAKGSAKHKVKRNHKEPAHPKECPQRAGLYSLPDHLIEEILRWDRPKDTDRSIWQWVCQMSATCAVFRRIICTVKSGGVPLTPTDLFVSNDHSIPSGEQEEADAQVRRQVGLISTIRQSDWMGQNIQSVRVLLYDHAEINSVLEVTRSLLTTPQILPNLASLGLVRGDGDLPVFVTSTFLHGVTNEHPDLIALSLFGIDQEIRDISVSTQSFGRLASSLPNLQRFKLREDSWMEPSHLTAFFSNVGSNMTFLALQEFGDSCLTEEVFESIAVHCHNIETLDLYFYGGTIRSLPFANILRANRNLSTLKLRGSRCESLLPDTIVEQSPRLKVLDAYRCSWVNDDFLMKLFNSQIRGFGRILLAELVISETHVTATGLRSVLTQWRETNPVQPLCVRIDIANIFYHVAGREAWQAVFAEFPEVEISSIIDGFALFI